MQIFSDILLQIAAEAERREWVTLCAGAGSVWVDAATGDSASLLFIKREMTGSSQPGDFAISGSIWEEQF